MKKIFSAAIAATTLCLLYTISLADTAANPAQQLTSLLKQFTTLTGKFDQQVYDDKGQLVQKNKGEVWIQRPGKFRWLSTVPTKQIVIANGPTLWTYDVDLQQATKQPFTQSKGVTPANLLSGNIAELENQFTITQNTDNKKQQTFHLVPKTKNDLFNSVDMTFDKNQLASMQVMNNLGQKINFDFSKIKLNKSIDPKLFEFTAPKGVDVIDNG